MELFSAKKDNPRDGEDKARLFTVLLLVALSVALCAAICLTFWSAEKSNTLPKPPSVQSGAIK